MEGCWGRGQLGRVFLIIKHRWCFEQEVARMPPGRHEPAQLVKGRESLGFPFATVQGNFKVIKPQRAGHGRVALLAGSTFLLEMIRVTPVPSSLFTSIY